ncbi:hypothetical protein HanIR_Chr16g0805731 [Helianthus annuus]|nr:hypothetical protein HanIR_Chr16g0805731 [Helianthus annuus]
MTMKKLFHSRSFVNVDDCFVGAYSSIRMCISTVMVHIIWLGNICSSCIE